MFREEVHLAAFICIIAFREEDSVSLYHLSFYVLRDRLIFHFFPQGS